jgi:hypothetical protein
LALPIYFVTVDETFPGPDAILTPATSINSSLYTFRATSSNSSLYTFRPTSDNKFQKPGQVTIYKKRILLNDR